MLARTIVHYMARPAFHPAQKLIFAGEFNVQYVYSFLGQQKRALRNAQQGQWSIV
jgi:hypothetical protein